MVDLRDRALDSARCLKRALCRPNRLAFEAEQRADPIGPNGDERSAGGADRLAKRLGIQRQQVEHVLGQPTACKLVAVDEVAKHHDDLAIGAGRPPSPAVDRLRRTDKRNHRDVHHRAQLTCEARVGRCADTAQRRLLILSWRRTEIVARRHAYSAGRAARSAAAHGGMRQMKGAARLKDRPPARHPHGLPRIGDRDQAREAAFQHIADATRAEGCADEAEIADQKSVVPASDPGTLDGMGQRQIVLRARGSRRIGGNLAAHGDEAERGQHRQQDRDGEQDNPQLPVQPPAIERKMQTETAVYPSGRQQAELHALGIRCPEIGDDAGVVRRQSEHVVSEPRVGEVVDEDERQREAQHDAHQLCRRQPKCPSLVHRPQREEKMGRCDAIEQDGARRASPDRHRKRKAPLGGAERNEAERMVDEMPRDVSEEHKARCHPQVSTNRAAAWSGDRFLGYRPLEIDRSAQGHCPIHPLS